MSQEWLSKMEVRRRAGLGEPAVMHLVAQCRQKHPEWYKILEDRSGNEIVRYAPAFADFAAEQAERRVPEGWTHCNHFGSTVREMAMFLALKNPDLAGYFQVAGMRKVMDQVHLSPEVIEHITGLHRHLQALSFPESVTATDLDRLLGRFANLRIFLLPDSEAGVPSLRETLEKRKGELIHALDRDLIQYWQRTKMAAAMSRKTTADWLKRDMEEELRWRQE